MHSLVLGLLVTGMAAPDGDLSKKIDFTMRATRCAEVVTKLRDLTGLDLNCTPAVAETVILCRVLDEPVQEVLNRVASATNGYWKVTDGKWSLRANSPVASNDLAERVKLIEAKKAFLKPRYGTDLSREKLVQYATRSLAINQRSEDPSAWTDPEFRKEFDEVRRMDPSSNTITKLFLRFGTQELARIGKSQRVVYSTQPTRMQVQLSKELGDIIVRQVEDQAVWNEILNRGMNSGGETPPESAPSKLVGARLVVTRGAYEGDQMSLGFQLMGKYQGSEEWQWLAADSIDLHEMSNRDTDYYVDPNNQPSGIAKPDEVVYKISDANRPLASWMDEVFDETRRVQQAEKMRAFLQDPLVRDPLSYGASDILLAYLEDAKLEAVIKVADSFFQYNRQFEGYDFTRRTIKETLDGYESYTDLKFEEKDGWLSVTNIKGPVRNVSVPMSRSELSSLLEQAKSGDIGSLDFKAGVTSVVGMDDGSGFSILYAYLGTFLGTNDLNTLYSDRKVMMFYRALGPTEKNSIVKGKGLRYGQLNPRAKAEFDSMVYGPGATIMRIEDEPSDADGQWMMSSEGEREMDWGGMAEPTELLASGIHPDTLIKFTPESSPMLEVVDDANPGPAYQVTPADIGSQDYFLTRPDLFPWVNEPGSPRYSQFRELSASRFRFYASINGVASITRYIPGKTVYLQDKPGPRANLSKAAKEGIAKGFEMTKKGYEENEGREGPATDGPPPPR